MNDEERELEVIRRGLASEFWAWLAARIREDIEAALIRLTDPAIPVEQVGFLRGSIRALNALLLLPGEFAKVAPEEPEEPDIPVGPRRLAPVEGDDGPGHPESN